MNDYLELQKTSKIITCLIKRKNKNVVIIIILCLFVYLCCVCYFRPRGRNVVNVISHFGQLCLRIKRQILKTRQFIHFNSLIL